MAKHNATPKNCQATLLPSLSGAGRTDGQYLQHPAGLPVPFAPVSFRAEIPGIDLSSVYGKCMVSCDGKS